MNHVFSVNWKLFFLTLVLLAVLPMSTSAQGDSNDIASVSPTSAMLGDTNVTVTITLVESTVPLPPSEVAPNQVMIGTLAGSNTNWNGQQITAMFDFSAATTGKQDVTVEFLSPDGTLPPFTLDDGFEIVDSNFLVYLPLVVKGAPTTSNTPTVVSNTPTVVSNTPTVVSNTPTVVSNTATSVSTTPTTMSNTATPTATSSETTPTATTAPSTQSYPIVDTNQTKCYDNASESSCPSSGASFYGQDAQHTGNQPSYTDNDNNTITDNVTGLMWQKSADTDSDGDIDADDKLTWTELQAYPNTLNAQNYGGHNDWRLPTIKELYSLILFSGTDPSGYEESDTSSLIPFIDTTYFDFAYGDTSAGERVIDAQYGSSTLYVSNSNILFGVNFADGRIKGYGLTLGPTDKTFFVICVRGNSSYGQNSFVDNGDNTITDQATGLIWSKSDSGTGLNWQEALAWVQTKNAENYLGHNDWRLPDVKELQSILDYTRSPDSSSSAAIDPLFNVTSINNEAENADYPFYWASTTHVSWNGTAGSADYMAFGRGLGYMNNSWVDVHGAGTQRSDPKQGDPADDEYIYGHGPQGDAIRIYNYVRLVR
ncbi:DUF1566 domain-containing protein [Anaerolineales bacterium HSG25]|nr:DUF1566 domain-containing protein [Anaerolineales bacterium HSG25]